MRCLFLAVIPAIILASAPVGLTPEVRNALGHGLDALGIEPAELGFYKQWAPDSFFKLSAVDYLLDNPLEVAGYVDSFALKFQQHISDPVALVYLQWRETDAGVTPGDTVALRDELRADSAPRLAGTETLPHPVGNAVNTILAGFRVGQAHLAQALAGLSARELDILLGEATGFWAERDTNLPKPQGALHREFGLSYDTTVEVKSESILGYARKLDRRALARAGLAVVIAARDAEAMLAAGRPVWPDQPAAVRAPGVDGPVRFHAETGFGPVVVGGEGNNHYYGDFCLIIEPGGNDYYTGRAGGAVGVIGNPFSVVIDLEGDDLYACSLRFSQGAAVFGAGVLIDRQGDDVYRAGDYSQGSGLFGTGLLLDHTGRDIYDAGAFTQGAGMLGVGTLVDRAGNDRYSAECYAQGFASVQGYGLLLEGAGNDVYYAGGTRKHEPLLPREYQSFAQGFSIGWRPDAGGGVGFLCDISGNDSYIAEVYAQGTAYWYALGALWDGEGYDTYRAAQYSQGAGIHLAVGCLIDNEGNDSYYSRLGPSQGAGHDLSVGVLLDRAGDDVYHCSGGQGYALTNSVGLFIDLDGNDVYSSTEPLSLAGGRPARGFASIGNFLDMAGRDYHTAGSAGANRSAWTLGGYGAGQNLDSLPVKGEAAEEGDTLRLRDLNALPLDSLFRLAATWEVGNARARVRQARRRLHRLGPRAVEWVAQNKADTKSGLELRAIELLVKEHPDTARPYLYALLRDERTLARNNAAYLLGQLGKETPPPPPPPQGGAAPAVSGDEGEGVVRPLKADSAADSVLLALREDRITPRRAVHTLGDIGDTTVVPAVIYLLEDEFEPSRVVTCEALGKLKAGSALPGLIRGLEDRLFTVRSAAEDALGKYGRVALEPLLDALEEQESPALGHSLRVLGRLAAELDTAKAARDSEPRGTERAAELENAKQNTAVESDTTADRTDTRGRLRSAFLDRLGHDAPFVRMMAVEGLGNLLDETLRQELKDRQAGESNRFVLAAYRKALEQD